MRTTVAIDDELLNKAAALTGIAERSMLLRDGLETPVRAQSARRLDAIGGSDKITLRPHAFAAPRGPDCWSMHLDRSSSS